MVKAVEFPRSECFAVSPLLIEGSEETSKMIISPRSPGTHDPHKRPRGILSKRFMVGASVMITLSYLTVVLACASMDGKYSHSSDSQNIVRATVIPEAPDHDELCKSIHEQILTLQAFSSRSIFVAKISHIDVPIDKETDLQIAILNGFRPPGKGFAPAQDVSFQLFSVLRI